MTDAGRRAAELRGRWPEKNTLHFALYRTENDDHDACFRHD